MLLQIFSQNFYSNAFCFSLLLLYLGNSQVSVYRTISPTLVYVFSCGSSQILLYLYRGTLCSPKDFLCCLPRTKGAEARPETEGVTSERKLLSKL